jgi:hypothetical protein
MGLAQKFLATIALTGALTGAANTTVELNKYTQQSTLPIPQLQVGTVANAGFNWCRDTERKVTNRDGYYIDSRLNSCGLWYIRMNPKAANFLVYQIEIGANTIGGSSIVTAISKALPPQMSAFGVAVTANLLNTKATMAYCANEGKNTMLKNYAWTGWLYATAYCE